ncbi:hypothetical protein OROGR_004344 [Orobanche gracilis]
MKMNLAVLSLLSLALSAYVIDASKDPGEYWKSVMNGEKMPKAITDLLGQNSASDFSNTNKFTTNFDTKPNLIIYHSHHDHVDYEASAPIQS